MIIKQVQMGKVQVHSLQLVWLHLMIESRLEECVNCLSFRQYFQEYYFSELGFWNNLKEKIV